MSDENRTSFCQDLINTKLKSTRQEWRHVKVTGTGGISMDLLDSTQYIDKGQHYLTASPRYHMQLHTLLHGLLWLMP